MYVLQFRKQDHDVFGRAVYAQGSCWSPERVPQGATILVKRTGVPGADVHSVEVCLTSRAGRGRDDYGFLLVEEDLTLDDDGLFKD